MMDFLNNFKSLVKLETVRTDNNVFRLHYKLTVIMLIVFSILLTSKQYFGEPIQCQVEANQNVQLVQAYCWIYGTFILKKTLKPTAGGIPGLGAAGDQFPWFKGRSQDGGIIWQNYYQWVCIVFCFQALLFYLPRYIWKTWEGGRLRLLVSDFMVPLVPSSWNATAKANLIRYLMDGRELHRLYAFRYTCCELLNLANVVCQIFLMDWFLTGQFGWYGFSLLFTSDTNPMTQVFPKLTKCTFYKYGPSGGLESRDAMCVLPLNILNEKLFLILWLWLFFLAAITILSLIYRALVFFVPQLRVYLLMAQAHFINRRQGAFIVRKLNYGDFFILYQVGKNINPSIYREVVVAIYEMLKSKNQYYPGFDGATP